MMGVNMCKCALTGDDGRKCNNQHKALKRRRIWEMTRSRKILAPPRLVILHTRRGTVLYQGGSAVQSTHGGNSPRSSSSWWWGNS